MFRKPREATALEADETPLLPSTGRPPTPPSSISQRVLGAPSTTTYSMATPTPLLGRSRTTIKKTPTMAAGKTKGKMTSNGNIMSFFKRVESATESKSEEDTLFLGESSVQSKEEVLTQTPTPPREGHSPQEEEEVVELESPLSRFNEDLEPSKRQCLGPSWDMENVIGTQKEAVRKGPFVDDSDSEGEGEEMKYPSALAWKDLGLRGTERAKEEEEVGSLPRLTEDSTLARDTLDVQERSCSPVLDENLRKKDLHTTAIVRAEEDTKAVTVPVLKRESTSVGALDGFDGIEDFIDDEFPEEGEEYVERRWMEEQAQFEMSLEDDQDGRRTSTDILKREDTEDSNVVAPQKARTSSCPICGGDTTNMTEQDISIHVNDCIDGKAKPLLASSFKQDSLAPAIKQENEVPGHKRFQRAAIARPGQENPFSLTSTGSKSSTAFSKLMSGHAEDTAWATAAASELASRGKPAYQRTCPFYKIMPGFFICVDAFRYGAVEGCKAYFLSHFHSDHYIGLTSSWCHGPIYCSHITANLVRRQLRVDPKWVIDLDFDNKVEVPDTQGVDVTMIPANHCPGSSLFLFEKVMSKGKNPKVQRVLHCGDFRACPAHVQHSKLRPDIVDTVTGRNLAQQKLDVCYLDTTYLTPKYAFPRQEEVIKACADMCVSLSKDFVDESDSWEQTKKERAGDGMVKFVRKTSIKEEEDEKDAKIKIEDEESSKRARGRLLVIVGTYSIGKERICLGVAKALNSKIYAPPNKQKICAALEDPELSARLTNDPLEAQVHMQMLMEIRAETLADYLTGYKPYFSRIVGFRPSGWNYRPPNSRFTESPSVQTVLHSDNWKSRYSMAELVPQRGSTREANCFGVPYSEHSSFRELTMFCCALRIDKIIPTVNVGSAKSRERMKAWCDKWAMEKKKNGLYKVQDGQTAW